MLGKMSSMNNHDSKNQEKGTRQRILEVAARLFAERGFDGATIREISAELGIANPSLYYHFESKGDILAELLAEPFDRLEKAVNDAENFSGIEKTRIILHGILDSLEVHSGIAITAFRNSSKSSKINKEIAKTIQPEIVKILADSVEKSINDLSITMATGAIDSVITSIIYDSTDGEMFVTRLRADRQEIVDLVLKLLY